VLRLRELRVEARPSHGVRGGHVGHRRPDVPVARRAAVVALASVALAAACTDLESLGAVGGIAMPPSAAGGRPPDLGGCAPFDPPVEGSGCAASVNEFGEPLTCEYGHDLDPSCNHVYECV